MSLTQMFKMTCHQATYLHEKRKDGKLSFSERFGLWVHLLFCKFCALFFKQMDVLEKAVHQHGNTENPPISLNADLKGRIQKALDDEMSK